MIPADTKQCQAEIPNGESFMTLGGRYKLVRCKNVPSVTVFETIPGIDGLMGSMCLCAPCLTQLFKQCGDTQFRVEPILGAGK